MDLAKDTLVYKYRVNSRMVGNPEVIQDWPSKLTLYPSLRHQDSKPRGERGHELINMRWL
jgi:hypothetical protein